MRQKLSYLKETPSQTAGPYVHIGLAPGDAGFEIYGQELGRDIAGPHAQGKRIRVEGVILDGTGSPIKDAMIEVWQANAQGHYPTPDRPDQVEDGFCGWGCVITDFNSGVWQFETVKPGPIASPDGPLIAPHINLWIVARGINVGLNTRLYFDDEATANATDPVLNLIEWESRRDTLIAKGRKTDKQTVYRFNIRLQGDEENGFLRHLRSETLPTMGSGDQHPPK